MRAHPIKATSVSVKVDYALGAFSLVLGGTTSEMARAFKRRWEPASDSLTQCYDRSSTPSPFFRFLPNTSNVPAKYIESGEIKGMSQKGIFPPSKVSHRLSIKFISAFPTGTFKSLSSFLVFLWEAHYQWRI